MLVESEADMRMSMATMAGIDRFEPFGGLHSVRDYVIAVPITRDDVVDVTPTVFVIDADISVRESLELLIRAAGCQPETFASAEEFLSRPHGFVPCCLVLDMRLPGLSGLELQKQLAERTDLPIIFISGQQDVTMTVQAMKAGAMEFLTKPFNDEALLQAIRAAIERSRAALLHDSEMRMLGSRYSSLTPREREVMTLVVSGLLNKQVGGELGISEITVKAHRGQVMRKMKADSLPHLVTMAAQLRLRHARANADAQTVPRATYAA
jgi:FixJ family two-component response regulator